MAFDADRKFTHEDLADGRPSRAAYNLGCRCLHCTDANSQYARNRAMGRIDSRWQHSHRGRPSAGSTDRHGCKHPTCLFLAGYVVTADGRVLDDMGREVELA